MVLLNNIVLGQIKVDEKSNEFKAIPTLIESSAIEGAVITIDAMRCQSAFSELLVSRKSNCILALEENQSSLL